MILHLIGNVNEDMLRQVVAALAKQPDTLTVRITSEGGDQDAGLAIAGLLESCGVPIYTEVVGYCYSAAVLIFAVGKRRTMHRWSWCMTHQGSDKIKGNVDSLKAAVAALESGEQQWNEIMQECTGTAATVWQDLSTEDSYLTAAECLKLNLATHII